MLSNDPIMKKPKTKMPIADPAMATSRFRRLKHESDPSKANTEKIAKIIEQPRVSKVV